MKIKYADYRNHKNIISKRCSKIEKNYNEKNIIAYLVISDKVKKEWYVPRKDGEECMHADGYRWLQIYGLESNVVVSAIFDENNNFVETYFDIARKIYMEDVPYAEDLYLDVVQTKENNFIILDDDNDMWKYKKNLIKCTDAGFTINEYGKCVRRWNKSERKGLFFRFKK